MTKSSQCYKIGNCQIIPVITFIPMKTLIKLVLLINVFVSNIRYNWGHFWHFATLLFGACCRCSCMLTSYKWRDLMHVKRFWFRIFILYLTFISIYLNFFYLNLSKFPSLKCFIVTLFHMSIKGTIQASSV